jgi:CBS domain-containing protein
MSIGKFCNRAVVTADPATSVVEASLLMRRQHVGDVIVADELPEGRRPRGIVTDRDIVVGVVAAGLDPALVKLADLIDRPLVTASVHDGYAETIERMAEQGVRRMPVLDEAGYLVGIITLDDLLQQLAPQLCSLAKIPAWERRLERRTRR